ncbi:ComF family protein [Yoonia sp. MH D7]
MRMQSIIRAIYPTQCVACDAPTEGDFGLCGVCWRDAQFISGTMCCKCGAGLPGDSLADDLICDECLTIARPWDYGRSVMAYSGVGRKLVLSLKHGDRTDLAQPAARWMARAAGPLLHDDTLIVPVPLHWVRLLRRRYNQSAALVNVLGKQVVRGVCADALVRVKRTKPLEGHSREARFAALSDAIRANPKRVEIIKGRHVLLVDDVMTSGATLAACTEACMVAGAKAVNVLTLARVVKDA